MTTYFLAVDGGGTKTDVVCCDQTGAVVGRGSSGPTNLTSTSVGAASFNLIEAIRQAVETLPEENQIGFTSLVMGLAGIDSQKEHDEAFTIFTRATAHYNIAKFVLVNDSVIALKNGTDAADAIILISGTGSICYGRNQAGAVAKASGMDYLLADQGSGYAIGRRVLREAVKSFDGRSSKSVLEKLVCEHFKIASVSELKTVVYHPPLTKIEVAELAPLCTQAFLANDQVAQEIFDKVVGEILNMITAVIRTLELEQKPCTVVLSGAVAHIEYVNAQVLQKLKQAYPLATVVTPQSDPVYGAVKIAIQG